jgi:glycosyltransferase involved in cell wall biosynthesis
VSSPEGSDLSLLTRDLARELGCETVVALGCPRPRRLAPLAGDLRVVALDGPERLEELRRHVPGAAGHVWDPADAGPLPVPTEDLRGAVVVCDGVLESLDDPAPLLHRLAETLIHAPCAVLVTPDRDLVRRGAPVEARWTAGELRDRLESEGLDVSWIGLASSHAQLERSSSMVVLGGNRAAEVQDLLATGARNLRFDPGAHAPARGEAGGALRVCIASYEFVGPTKTGGIGTAYTSLAEALAEAGHEVTVLFLGLRDPADKTPFSHWVDHYAAKGIQLVEVPESELPRVYFGHFEAKRSYLAYLWLSQVDRQRPFDVIHFPETLGHAYYSLLAKRHGLAFDSATIAVGVHSSTYWVMETNRVPYLTGQEFAADFLERASVALADVVISPSAYMVDWMQNRGWELPRRVFVQQYVTSRVVTGGDEPVDAHGGIDEIVFFGRLETRKGIVLFCDALDLLAADGALPAVSIAFMGKQTLIEGALAEDYIAARAGNWPWQWRILDDFGQPEAVSYLRGNGARRLAVMPSLADNTPNTVMEALALRIPFIASRVGGTAELVHPHDLGRSTFDPGGREADADLAAALHEAVEASEFRPPEPAVDPAINEEVHLRWHDAVAAAARAATRSADGLREPLSARVSVCLLARDSAQLREVIASLEAQEHPAVEVVMVGNGTARPDLVTDLERAEQTFEERGWKLLRTDRRQRPEALNEGVRAASGRYLLFLAERAVAEPQAISRLVRVAERTGADIVTAAATWSVGSGSGIRPPEGGPPVAGLFYRCFGDGGYLISRRAFEALGGFDAEAEPGAEDHHLLCRAALEGLAIEIVPEPLIRERLEAGVQPGEAIHADSAAVLSAYEKRASDGLVQLPQIARAQWSLAGSKDAQIRGIVESRSWRLTTPLRWVTAKLGRSSSPPPAT